jgi:c(7)-type cytochrome triheme protein
MLKNSSKWLLAGLIFLSGCGGMYGQSKTLEGGSDSSKYSFTPTSEHSYYEKFYEDITTIMYSRKINRAPVTALEALPKGPKGYVNWTAAVLQGYLNPRGSLDPDVEEEKPFDLNIFIEAKVPLMNNVIFPHSIHTYWLSCNNCHPGIFIPEAGANPISMDEIFRGKWCGRCHGKVAFPFGLDADPDDPRSNCNRCHMIPKGESLERERW